MHPSAQVNQCYVSPTLHAGKAQPAPLSQITQKIKRAGKSDAGILWVTDTEQGIRDLGEQRRRAQRHRGGRRDRARRRPPRGHPCGALQNIDSVSTSVKLVFPPCWLR